MTIQKINYNPSFGARTAFFNTYEGSREPSLSRQIRNELAEIPDLPDGKKYGLFYDGFDRSSDISDSRSFEELSIAICDSRGNPLSEKIIKSRLINNNMRPAIRDYFEKEGDAFCTLTQKLVKELDDILSLGQRAAELGFKFVRK